MKPFLKKRYVLIVADGPSAAIFRTFQVPQEIHIIGVNHASIWLPRVDTYVTAVPNVRQRLLMRNRRPGVRYCAVVPPAYGSAFADPELQGPRERNVTFFGQSDRYVRGEHCFGHNSAAAALNIASEHMKAQRIAIVGIDGNNEPRVSGGKPNDLENMPAFFSLYQGDADVVNGTPRSTVTAFPVMQPLEAISWLL